MVSLQNTPMVVILLNLHNNTVRWLLFFVLMLEIRKWRIKENTTLKSKTKWNKTWQKSFGPWALMSGQCPCLVILTSLKPGPLDSGFSHYIGDRLWQVRTLRHRRPASVIKRSHTGLWPWPHHPFGCLLSSTVALEMESMGCLCQGISDQAPGRFPVVGSSRERNGQLFLGPSLSCTWCCLVKEGC